MNYRLAEADALLSTFTPVPKRLLDGSEDTDVLPAAVLSGAPIELQARTVRYACHARRRFDCSLTVSQNLQAL